jgi:hypothetical protein
MRLLPLLLLASPALAAPALSLFGGAFPAGLYADSRSARSEATRRCFTSADPLIHAGRPVGPSCRVTVLEDNPGSAVISWTCPGGDSGRSEIRRDHAGLFTVRAQGIAGKRPFAETHEYRRVGDC